jgi:ATP/maltotriose-dependent transcriptional regulator MalT
VALHRSKAGKPFEPIIRERVMERLSAACAHRIALVVAPAGFGKSVAVRHFLERVEMQHVRYALRGEHATLLGFARGLAEALQPVVPGAIRSVAEAYEKVSKSASPAMDLAVWACAQIKQYHGTVVIDDFHEAIDPDVSKFVAEIVERTEETTRWLIVTRETLQLPIATWFAYGRIDAPVDEGDLKITLEEATELVESIDVVIRGKELDELLTLTEGWPVAFTFALRSSMRTDDFKRIIANTRMLTFDYLAEQVFSKLREDERAFLLDTCVFPTIDVDQLARNGRPQVGMMIEELRKRTAFISVESERTYRYHELFRQYLLRALENTGSDELCKRQLAAASLYENEGNFAQSLTLYAQANSEKDILRILVCAGFDLLEIGRSDLVEIALNGLPEVARRQAQLFALRAALESAAGNYDRTDACYGEALRLADDQGVVADIVQRYIQDLHMRLEYVKVVTLIETYGLDIFVNRKVRARVFAILASAYGFTFNKEKSTNFIEQSLSISATVEDEALLGFVLHQAAYIAYFHGEYEASEAYEQKVMKICKNNGFDGLMARAFSVLSSIFDERGDTAQRLFFLQQMGTYAERAGHRGMAMHAIMDTYEIQVEKGGGDVLKSLEEKLSHFDTNVFIRSAGALLSSFALQATWTGNFSAAVDILRDSLEKQRGVTQTTLRWSEIAVYAAAAGERELAEDAAQRVLAGLQEIEGQGAGKISQVPRARVFLALAQLLMGRSSSANNTLQQCEWELGKCRPSARALYKAVRALYVHLETGAGELEISKAFEALNQAGLGGFVRLLNALPLPTQAKASSFSLLTKTELAILKALANGNSSKEIGVDMERSALTVDTHVKSIIRKLGCKGRREAVSLARQQGIVEGSRPLAGSAPT